MVAGVLLTENQLGSYLLSEAKANGYLEYSPEEAHTLAKNICTQCHSEERNQDFTAPDADHHLSRLSRICKPSSITIKK